MPLWNISVGDVSQRYVDAPTKAAAIKSVERDLIANLRLSATRAPEPLEKVFRQSGPIQRKEILAAMDGLNAPRAYRNNKTELKHLQTWVKDTENWIAAEIAKAPPPPDPVRVARLLREAEIKHVEKNLQRLGIPDRSASVFHQT